MPYYHKLGQIPHKRHTQFRKLDGGLYREEVMGLEGFSGIQSILYHHFLPPRVRSVEDLGSAGRRICGLRSNQAPRLSQRRPALRRRSDRRPAGPAGQPGCHFSSQPAHSQYGLLLSQRPGL